MREHAYLIMAHNDFHLLKILLSLIDDERNDIYVHIDQKAGPIDTQNIAEVVKRSNIYFTDRTNVTWGSVSQIKCELLLLQKSSKGNYDYYHLLSGQDLPIKSQDYIHNFFDKNQGKEFVRFNSETFNFQARVKYYYFFIDKIGRKKTLLSQAFRLLEKSSLSIQRILGVNRIKGMEKQYQKGTNWFSITNDLAKYIVRKSESILKKYKFTLCCDEIFLQTLIINSYFVNKLFHSKFDDDPHAIMRLIDWTRGEPYIFRKDDYKELITSDMLFARKFSTNVDKGIIAAIVRYVNGSS